VDGQTWPQPPQFFASLLVSTHWLPQQLWPAGQHAPLQQVPAQQVPLQHVAAPQR
jgi:hypothetical protein